MSSNEYHAIPLLLGIIGAALMLILAANAFLLKSILNEIHKIERLADRLSFTLDQFKLRLENLEEFQRDIHKRLFTLEQKEK